MAKNLKDRLAKYQEQFDKSRKSQEVQEVQGGQSEDLNSVADSLRYRFTCVDSSTDFNVGGGNLLSGPLYYSKDSPPEMASKPTTNLTPQRIVEKLNKHVIGQDSAKKSLATAAYYHFFSKVKAKQRYVNTILIGPTGCGKTYLIKNLAKIIDVPYVTVDATELTPEGYVGKSVDECVEQLTKKDSFKGKGIIFIDEFDKLGAVQWGLRGLPEGKASGSFKSTEIQQAFLKLLEGDYSCEGNKSPFNYTPSASINDTKGILFIAGGAFGGISEYLNEVTPEHIISMGFMPEFIGRFPIIAKLDQLDKGALINILTSTKNSLLHDYQNILKGVGVSLVFKEEAIEEIAEAALALGTGARGLISITEKVLGNLLFTAPGSSQRRFEVTEDYVKAKLLPTMEIH